MKHAFRHACLAALLTLTACADRVAPDEITLPARAQQSEDWSRFLPALYPGLMACLNAHPAQPARADDVVPQNHGMILVRVTGADGASTDCQAGSGGTPAPRLEPAETRPLKGPAFTPATMAEPFAPCFLPEPVLTRDGRLLGWLSYRRPDCERGQTPVLQDNWRVFGNEPFWTVRIASDGIVLDRLGDLPRRYPAAPPESGERRRSWVVDPPDGNARDRLEVIITDRPCSDSMADRQYYHSAEVMFGGQTLHGCAERAAPIP
ncbi:MAG: COG3650 family protein [Ferrovibrio sp.]|uniref:COG3650 family protein n=1 Tax=Ferrovibrio sp. TaxID=1917215 RepID=UPI00391BE2C8